jgi:hypothetical protein
MSQNNIQQWDGYSYTENKKQSLFGLWSSGLYHRVVVQVLTAISAMRSSETLVITYKTIRCHKPEENNQHFHRRENLMQTLFVEEAG